MWTRDCARNPRNLFLFCPNTIDFIEILPDCVHLDHDGYQFKVDRPQTTVVAKNLSVLQLFISRIPKMCAILQLVSGPLNRFAVVVSQVTDCLSNNLHIFKRNRSTYFDSTYHG